MEGGLVVKILFGQNSPGDDSHHGIQVEPVEVEFDAETILTTDVVEVKVVLLPSDKVEATVVLHLQN